MKQTKKISRKVISYVLTLVLALSTMTGIVPGMSLTAYAYYGNPYASLVNTTTDVTFDGKKWYIIEDNSTAVDAGTVTLLAKECVGESQYSGNDFVKYSQSTVKTVVDNWYNNNITADAKTAVSDGVMFLLTTAQANAINAEVRKDATVASNFSSGWWLCSMGNADNKAALVFGGSGEVYADGLSVLLTRGVRPALKLDLSEVVFKSSKNTFSLPTEYTALDVSTQPVITVKRGGTAVTEGAPQIGDVLTAETGATDLEYEWYRDNEIISGAETDTYPLTTADVGKTISVKVYQTKKDDGTNYEENARPTLTSAATAVVEKKTNTMAQVTADALSGSITKDDTSITIGSTSSDYEYIVVAKDTTPDWTSATTGTGNAMTFYSLSAGTDYDVYVRAKATDDETQPGEATKVTLTTNVTVAISGTPTEGQAVNVTITPSTTGVTYKWYIDDGDTPDGTGEKIVPSKGGTKLKVEVYSGDPETLIGTTTTTTPIKTLAEVINDSNDAPVTITLDGPVTGGISIPAGKEVILDIKGQQVNGDIDVPATSTLTITDNSNPQTGTVKGTVKANTGTVIIESGKFDKTPVATNPGTVTIKGGLFKEEPTTILNVPYEVKGSGNQDYPYEVYKAYEALTTENKPTISTTKATGNTDENPQIGDKLTATTAAKPVTYQWYSDGVAIENATTDSYVITADDLGKAITVSITQSTNENGSNLETPLTQTSDATTAIVKSDVQAVGDVETMIDDLPATTDVTIADKDAIEAAKEAYDALSDAQKAKVNTDKLNALNADLVALVISEASAKTGNDVIYTGNQIKLINTPTTALPAGYTLKYAVTTENTAPTDDNLYTTSIPEKTDVGTYYVWYKVIGNQNYTDTAVVTISEPDKTELEAAIAAAEEFYNSIKDTDDYKTIAAALKEAITTAKTADDSSTVTAGAIASAKEEIATAKKTAEDGKKDVDDKAAADAVTNMINTLPMADQVKTTDKESIVANRKAYDALTADQKAKVDATTLKKLTDAETALAAAEKKETDDANAVKKVNDSISKLPANDKVATTDKAAIEAARKAYDALSADQKAKVDATTLKKLTDAETALAAAEKKAAEEKAAKELAAAKEEAQAAMNEQVTVTQKGNKFTIKWKKSSSADGYYVYASYCDKKETKPVKTIKKNTTTKTTITKINGKKINQKKNFHVYVVPYKIIDGKKVTLGKSTVAHLVGSKNTKYSNVKKLTLTKKKYTVKVGKTAKIKAKVTLVNKNKKHIPKGHGAKFRYKSSDTSIATVSKNGKIKGIKKGTCTIYVYSINGLVKKAKVTVK